MALEIPDFSAIRTSRIPRSYDSETGNLPSEQRAALDRSIANTIARLTGDNAMGELVEPLGGAEAAVEAIVADYNSAVVGLRAAYASQRRDLLNRGRAAGVGHIALAEDEADLDRTTIDAFNSAKMSALAQLDALQEAAAATQAAHDARTGGAPDLETAARKAIEDTQGLIGKWQRELNLRLQAIGPRAADMRAVVERFAREYLNGPPAGVNERAWHADSKARALALGEYVAAVRELDGGPDVVAAHELLAKPDGGSALTRQNLVDRGRSEVNRLASVIERAVAHKPATANTPAPNPRPAAA